MTDYTKKFGYSEEYLKKMIPINSNRCMCPTCGLFFKSIRGFDMHRRNMKCLSEEEMLDKGMAINKTGHWVSRLMSSDPTGFTVEKTSQESGV